MTLREARTRRKLTLEEAEQATRVRLAFLQALEEERWDLLPARAYTQGLLTVYARYLGLDPGRLVPLLPPEELDPGDFAPPPLRTGPSLPVLPVVAVLVVAAAVVGGFCAMQALAGLNLEAPRLAPAPEPARPSPGPTITVVTPTPPQGGGVATAAPAPTQPAATPTPAAPPTPPPVSTPPLLGRSWQQAVEALRALGLNAVRVEEYSETVPQEQVMAQDPAPGQPAAPDRNVRVTVSLGRPGVTVPDVVGKPEAEARAILTQAGLVPGRFANYQGRADLPDAVLRSVCVGCVLSTTPGAGSQHPPGTTVFLAVRRE